MTILLGAACHSECQRRLPSAYLIIWQVGCDQQHNFGVPNGRRAVHRCHSHMRRHACGFKLANDGHDTRAIQAYLGVVSLTSWCASRLGVRGSSQCASHPASVVDSLNQHRGKTRRAALMRIMAAPAPVFLMGAVAASSACTSLLSVAAKRMPAPAPAARQ
jgi:hypothetical protein